MRKQHVIWANGITHCGLRAVAEDVNDPRLAQQGRLCKRCAKSVTTAFPTTSIYNTVNIP